MDTSGEAKDITDLLIIGGGPTGMFAAFYGGMRRASVKLIESLPQLGGQPAALYPDKYIYDVAGYPKVTAKQLTDSLSEQMAQFQTEIRLNERVLRVEKAAERRFQVETDKAVHHAKAVIITAGAGAFEPRRLEVDGAAFYEGKQLHYHIHDLNRFREKEVLVVGGGDSAVDWALMLEPVAKQVHLAHRRDRFRAHEHSVERLQASSVNVLTPFEITKLSGGDRLAGVTLTSTTSGETRELPIDGLVVSYGFVSSLGPIAEWGMAVEKHSILVNSRMETSVPGLFAAGDIVNYPGKVKLIAVGFGEAPTAVNNAVVYIDPAAKLAPGHSSSMKW